MTLKPGRDFERWTLGWDRTWAYRLFKNHHTQLNSMYWSHAAARVNCFGQTRSKTGLEPTSTLFPLPPPDASRVNKKLRTWGDDYGKFDNWVRLSCLVAAASYLEVYIATVIQLALQSCPGILIGEPLAVDGVKRLKGDALIPTDLHVQACVKGSWSERLAAYKKIFGGAPAGVMQEVGELDRMRRIRNGVSHSFGRDVDAYHSLTHTKAIQFKKIEEAKLKTFLALIDRVAIAIDNHLAPYIGDYETVLYYHNHRDLVAAGATAAKPLMDALFEAHGRRHKVHYAKGLIAYYHSV